MFKIRELPLLLPLIIVLPSSISNTHSQIQWQEINTVDEACRAYPERMESMLKAFNLELKGLEEVKRAYESDNIKEACYYLLEYYKNGNSAKYLRKRKPPVSQKTTTLADSIIQDIFTFQLVCDKVPRLSDGHLDWQFSGPEGDPEWAWALNRNYLFNKNKIE